MKHTPEPWVVNRGEYAYMTNPLYKGIVALLEQSGPAPEQILFVANPDDHYVSSDEWEPNARLIAAAPEQNAALLAAPEPPLTGTHREVHDFLIAYGDWYRGPRKAAIAKVEDRAAQVVDRVLSEEG